MLSSIAVGIDLVGGAVDVAVAINAEDDGGGMAGGSRTGTGASCRAMLILCNPVVEISSSMSEELSGPLSPSAPDVLTANVREPASMPVDPFRFLW